MAISSRHVATANTSRPEVSLLVSSYNKPRHLRMCLHSIALQVGLSVPPEVIISDDGSDEPTLRVIEEFAAQVDMPVIITTHKHVGFQLARCRNDGVRASSAPYLIFLDGDCILPPDHVASHLALRRPGQINAGDCCRLEEEVSQRVTLDVVESGEYRRWGSRAEAARLRRRHWSTILYRWWPHPRKPTLIGNNIGIWRSDYERVNGYDEEFVGWGCEDDDLARRLRRHGLRITSVLHRTHTFHLWHPVDATAPISWKQGANVHRLLEDRPTVCERGLFDLRDPELRDSLLPFHLSDTRIIPLGRAAFAQREQRRAA